MPSASSSYLAHILCVLILVGRVGDLLSTRLATPTLKLEANPVVRKLGWRFAVLTLLLCLIPYYNTAIGVVALVFNFFVCFSNFGKVWLLRTMGETEYDALLCSLARKSTLSSALIPFLTAQGFLASIGGILLLLSGGEGSSPFWVALGLLLAAFGLALHGTMFIVRLFRRAARPVGVDAS